MIGGSGFYSLLAEATELTLDTPYGSPSGPVSVGTMTGRRVAFIARHGPAHEIPPHRINVRANLWALGQLGVTRVIGPCAVGSLRYDLRPGDFVALDQLVDRTWGRADTYFDGPQVAHVSFADPYCPELTGVLLASASRAGFQMHPGGTAVVIQGPRFSTRAESAWFRSAGWDVVNMTQYPEAYLARELGMCYAGLGLVTDYDTGVEGDPSVAPVTMEAVMEVLASGIERTRRLLEIALAAVPPHRSCTCAASASSLH